MRAAYLGIANKHRLLGWWPEHPELQKLLTLRKSHRTGEVCFWAVLPEEAANQIMDCLELGEVDTALRFLEQNISEAGRILPSRSERIYRV